MTRDELIEKMAQAYMDVAGNDMCKCLSAALDVAIAELLKDNGTDHIVDLALRGRADYYSAKPDPAVEAVKKILNEHGQFNLEHQIVAAIDAARGRN